MTLTHRFAEALPEMCTPWSPECFPDLQVAVFNDALGRRLGIDGERLLAALGDEERNAGHAQAYAGHQFGQFVPLLGDGRALLLGEVEVDGQSYDIHLKGSGPTPFARGGDGQAAIGPMLREYLVSEAMAGLNIPTTRSLAVLTTGKRIQRETVTDGALLVRVARSHLRVGSLQHAALRGEETLRKTLDYAVATLSPGSSYKEFYAGVVESQAALVAKWMRAGFVHGVMNTDNTALSGETIDYGPCAFIDEFDPDACFSSIDRQGRYAFRNQPAILGWNLARLAEAMIPLLSLEDAHEVLGGYASAYRRRWLEEMADAVGLAVTPPVEELLDDLAELLPGTGIDYHRFLRGLAEAEGAGAEGAYPPEVRLWLERWRALGPDTAALSEKNPLIVPRNHLLEEALALAEGGDLSRVDLLARAFAKPYAWPPDASEEEIAWLDRPVPPRETPFVTYCGT
ncbi:protein adenylyltransferase SelO family protein [Corynebacterium vitaeruminis]|uniref:protein adenylyltransferase SelO family protein n=1 Tax=Corynebacterium vitaeruminis TaxID=38305 RepID=UPI000557F447|nr:protein adenylyltransferase SelO family protein [Corynebacterium vitaeruminis]